MEHLEKQNLISGVIDATARNTAHDNITAPSDAASVDRSENQPEPLTDGQVEGIPSEQTDNDSKLEEIVGKVFDRTISRFQESLVEAEERGFRRALEMARQPPEALGISRSVPNFLADVRRDVWDA